MVPRRAARRGDRPAAAPISAGQGCGTGSRDRRFRPRSRLSRPARRLPLGGPLSVFRNRVMSPRRPAARAGREDPLRCEGAADHRDSLPGPPARGAQQPVEKVPRVRTPPGRKQESASIRGCGALFPQAGGPNRFRDSLQRLSRGGRTLPAPLPGGATRRVCARSTFSTACQGARAGARPARPSPREPPLGARPGSPGRSAIAKSGRGSSSSRSETPPSSRSTSHRCAVAGSAVRTRMFRASRSSRAGSRAASANEQPPSANLCAMARPISEEAPLTSAVSRSPLTARLSAHLSARQHRSRPPSCGPRRGCTGRCGSRRCRSRAAPATPRRNSPRGGCGR